MSKLKRIGIGFLALLGGAAAVSQTIACMPGVGVIKPEYCVAATVAKVVLDKVNEDVAPDSRQNVEDMNHPQ